MTNRNVELLNFSAPNTDEAEVAPVNSDWSEDLNMTMLSCVTLAANSNPFIPNHYPIPPTLGIHQAQRDTTSSQVDLGT